MDKNNKDNCGHDFDALAPQDGRQFSGPIQFVSIIGQIEGHTVLPEQNKATKYEHIIPILSSIEETDEVKGFIMLLNTMGGDVEAGLAIAEMVSGISKPSVSLVLGGGHSIGIPLAVSADRSMIAGSAVMTVHPIRMTGLVIGVPQTYTYFRRMQERITDFICAHSNIDRDILHQYLLETDEMANDMGKILVGKEAVDCGLIDQVGTIANAVQYIKSRINN